MYKMKLRIKPVGEQEIVLCVKDLQDADSKLRSYLSKHGPDVDFEIKGKAVMVTNIQYRV